ncbi:MAG: hypothetical protein ABI688_09490 [Bacteroidota bacterium]
MDRKTFTIVLGLALIVAFFLPLTLGVSAFDLVKGRGGNWQKYLWLIPPICGALLLMGELNNNYVVSRSFLTWMPLLTIIYFLILAPLIDKVEIGTILKSIGKGYGIGLWINIVASLVLAFYNPPPR